MKPDKTYILQEQQHLENLRKIIKRDFFSSGVNEEQAIKMTLNSYLTHFKSNQSQIFSQLVHTDAQQWKQKNRWMEKCKQLMLQSSSNNKQFSNMIGRNPELKAIDHSHTHQQALNGVFFNHNAETKSYQADAHDQAKKIYYANCSVDQQEIERMKKYQKKKYQDPNLQEIPQTPLLEGKHHKKDLIQDQKQYSMIRQASPEPQKVPIMTWGQVQSTPMRIKQYKIPEIPQRDEVLNQLNSKLVKQKIIKKTKKDELKMKILSSMRPNLSSYRKNSEKRYESIKREPKIQETNDKLDGLLNFPKKL